MPDFQADKEFDLDDLLNGLSPPGPPGQSLDDVFAEFHQVHSPFAQDSNQPAQPMEFPASPMLINVNDIPVVTMEDLILNQQFVHAPPAPMDCFAMLEGYQLPVVEPPRISGKRTYAHRAVLRFGVDHVNVTGSKSESIDINHSEMLKLFAYANSPRMLEDRQLSETEDQAPKRTIDPKKDPRCRTFSDSLYGIWTTNGENLFFRLTRYDRKPKSCRGGKVCRLALSNLKTIKEYGIENLLQSFQCSSQTPVPSHCYDQLSETIAMELVKKSQPRYTKKKRFEHSILFLKRSGLDESLFSFCNILSHFAQYNLSMFSFDELFSNSQVKDHFFSRI